MEIKEYRGWTREPINIKKFENKLKEIGIELRDIKTRKIETPEPHSIFLAYGIQEDNWARLRLSYFKRETGVDMSSLYIEGPSDLATKIAKQCEVVDFGFYSHTK